jgi:hypothetical protein
MSQVYPFSPREDSVEAGHQFADFAREAMARAGLVINYFESRQYQFRYGDSRVMEFKRDDTMTGYPPARFASGRASIEVAERAKSPNWTKGGIFAEKCPPFYTHGNPDLFAVFETRRLQRFHEREKPKIAQYGKDPDWPTVRKFYLSMAQWAQLAILIFEKGELKLQAASTPDAPIPMWPGKQPSALAASVRFARSLLSEWPKATKGSAPELFTSVLLKDLEETALYLDQAQEGRL